MATTYYFARGGTQTVTVSEVFCISGNLTEAQALEELQLALEDGRQEDYLDHRTVRDGEILSDNVEDPEPISHVEAAQSRPGRGL